MDLFMKCIVVSNLDKSHFHAICNVQKKTDLLYMSNKKENNVSVHTNFVLKQCFYGVMN